MSSGLSRRFLLRGAGGAALALPALDVMMDRHGLAWAKGGKPSRRYAVLFGGTALGGDGDASPSQYVPTTVGRNFDLKTALAPLAEVKDEVSVVSGLRIPTGRGGPAPAGGRVDDFHVSSSSPLLSGMRANTSNALVSGATSDQIVADAIAASLPFKSLVYRAQAAWYLSVAAASGRDYLSYKKEASGRTVPIPAATSPAAAFKALFGGFMPPPGGSGTPSLDLRTRARRSVLDLVRGNVQTLLPRLGQSDRARLQRHFDEIRDLERRIGALPPATAGLACRRPTDPVADPVVGGSQPGATTGGISFNTNNGYSQEDDRARIFCDLVHMAFACDMARVASLMLTMFQSHMSAYPIIGARCDLHEVGHNGDPRIRGTTAVSKVVAWHVKHFAYLVGKLRDTPEGSGRLIDNTVLVLLHEGGHGLDTATGKAMSTHSTENMACLIAGRAGGLRPGKHVASGGKHPANVLVSAMNAAGVAATTLGEVAGGIPELFTA